MQDGAAVAGWDRTTGNLLPIGVEGLTLGTDQKAIIGSQDLVSMAGGTLAVLNPQSGDLWAMRYSPDDSLGSLAPLDRTAPKVDKAGKSAAMAVGTNGVIYTVSAAIGMTIVTPSGNGFSTVRKPLEAPPSGALSITAVGDVPVVLAQSPGAASATLLIRGVDPVPLDDAAQAVLQQPGPVTPSVLVASKSALYSASLGSQPSVNQLVSLKMPGHPAAPVQLRGCVFAAWYGTPGFAASSCGADKPQPKFLLPDTADLVFRVNRQQVLLNELPHGRLWDLDSGTPAELDDDWSKIRPSTSAPKSSSDPHPRDPGQQHKPPIAIDDKDLGARAGRTTALYVLDNDSDPAGRVLTVSTISQPSSSALTLAVAPDGQTVLLTLPPGVSGSYHFRYTDSDGQILSQPATVTVTVRPDGEYREPKLRPGSPSGVGRSRSTAR